MTAKNEITNPCSPRCENLTAMVREVLWNLQDLRLKIGISPPFPEQHDQILDHKFTQAILRRNELHDEWGTNEPRISVSTKIVFNGPKTSAVMATLTSSQCQKCGKGITFDTTNIKVTAYGKSTSGEVKDLVTLWDIPYYNDCD